MAFNANFVAAAVQGDRLVVRGRSDPPGPLPIMVTLHHAGTLSAELVGQPDEPAWTVAFGPGEFVVGEKIDATGVAVLDGREPPFIWHDRLEIADQLS